MRPVALYVLLTLAPALAEAGSSYPTKFSKEIAEDILNLVEIGE